MTNKNDRLCILLSCIKSASRAQQIARIVYDANQTDENRLAWIAACNKARDYEHRILALYEPSDQKEDAA